MWVDKRGVCSRRLRLICFTLSTSKYPTVCGEAATVRFVRSRLGARYVSFHGRQRRFRNSGIRKYYYISMTALVDLDLLPRRAFLSTTFALPSFTSSVASAVMWRWGAVLARETHKRSPNAT